MIAAPSASAATGASPGPARFTVRPLQGITQPQLHALTTAGTTIPLWSGSVQSLGSTYNYTMVGNDPRVTEATPSTTVPTDIIPVRIVIGGTSFNPSVTSACSPSLSPKASTRQSPVFTPYAHSAGSLSLGTVQYVDGFQRENFGHYIFGTSAVNHGYHVKLGATVRPQVTVTVPSGKGSVNHSASCGPMGLIDISWWDGYLQNTLLPSLSSETTPTRFPVLLFSNVVLYEGTTANCCILGYHSAYSSATFGGAIQTYATADYDSTELFSGANDVAPLSHEVAEWMDDPFGNNGTPAWGHIGQVSGCQGNLEVGDPLSGTTVPVTMSNGFTYHPQELAFFSWFYRQKPSIGVHNWYSSNDTFTSGAGPACT